MDDLDSKVLEETRRCVDKAVLRELEAFTNEGVWIKVWETGCGDFSVCLDGLN